MSQVHIVLLRGVNVGGRPLPMADLRAWAKGLGFSNARTLIASGNLIMEGGASSGADLETLLEREAVTGLNLKTAFFVRTPQEWRAMIETNPFPAEAEEHPAKLIAHLTKETVPAAALKTLREAITGPERVEAGKRVLYIDFPEGQGRSTLDRDWARTKAAPLGTSRNWNTVLKILKAVEG
ncbi:DUF1697 domain-containing protein [Brevundimonas sp. 2R-24]|uniref:DUF1697 domain-containing protein n=1 Tax=Peiella sedimenti TaxID=3061083 RepID=A0ABT8SND6_9CAUL|nr:DUF1697 domain-containing protein [Caulobacteraceae bacterium XZ-24]